MNLWMIMEKLSKDIGLMWFNKFQYIKQLEKHEFGGDYSEF